MLVGAPERVKKEFWNEAQLEIFFITKTYWKSDSEGDEVVKDDAHEQSLVIFPPK